MEREKKKKDRANDRMNDEEEPRESTKENSPSNSPRDKLASPLEQLKPYGRVPAVLANSCNVGVKALATQRLEPFGWWWWRCTRSLRRPTWVESVRESRVADELPTEGM